MHYNQETMDAMVYDFGEGRILGEIGDLEEEIQVIEALIRFTTVNEMPDKRRAIERTLNRLKYDKEHQERRLQNHRQRVRESVIKF